MIYEENRVRRGKTLGSTCSPARPGIPKNIAAYFDLIGDFKPEVVISDFESWTYLYAKTHRLPILSIDNMQIINRCTHDAGRSSKGHEREFQLTSAFIKGKLPFCDDYFITTFFRPPTPQAEHAAFPADPAPGDPRGEAHARRSPARLPDRRGQHGSRRHAREDRPRVPHLRHAPRDQGRASRGQPPLPPVQRSGLHRRSRERARRHRRRRLHADGRGRLPPQADARRAARRPVRAGYERALPREARLRSRRAESLDDPKTVHDFVAAIPACEEKLAAYAQDGNSELFRAVDEYLDRAAAGVS